MRDNSLNVPCRSRAPAQLWRALAYLACISVFGSGAGAAERAPCDLVVVENVIVSAVSDGGRFELADGRHVRLAAIQAPMLSLGRANIVDWPLAGEAKERLSKLVLGKTVGLAYEGHGVDRHGDVLAYAFVDPQKEWLQALLVEAGMARVQTRAEAHRCAVKWLSLESAARKAERGIWSNVFYRVRKAETLDADIGTFQLVEGKIVSIGERRDRLFLNFGPDYRADFTVTISPRDRKRMLKEGIDPTAWNGISVRIRGWVSLLNGPEIELTHPEQIEILR